MTFFTETDLVLGQTTIPTGGYTMYLIPAKKEWTLIVSRNTSVGAKYDDKQDLARAQMETGQLSSPADKLSLYFGHTGPKSVKSILISARRAAGFHSLKNSSILA